MNTILELREKRAKAWETAKAFLDSKRTSDHIISAEDEATYDRMEAEVVALGKEIDRLERQAAIDRELSAMLNQPLTAKPNSYANEKSGRASNEYKAAFWSAIRSKLPSHDVLNALQVGTDSEGGYLVPDEFERTLVQSLSANNILRSL